jgi:hypothetical protein
VSSESVHLFGWQPESVDEVLLSARADRNLYPAVRLQIKNSQRGACLCVKYASVSSDRASGAPTSHDASRISELFYRDSKGRILTN